MHGGELFAEVVCVAAVLSGGAWVVWQMKLGRDTAVSDGTWRTPWGEIVEVPREAKARGSRSNEGESHGIKAARAQKVRTRHSHHDGER